MVALPTLHQRIRSKAKDDDTSLYVNARAKRIILNKQKVTTKHSQVQDFIESNVSGRWNQGLPLTKEELKAMVTKHAKTSKWDDWLAIYGQCNFSSDKKLWIYLSRAVAKIGFSVRTQTVPQKVPNDWFTGIFGATLMKK